MNYSMGSGIIKYIRASKTFSKFRVLRSSLRFEVPCASKFRVGAAKSKSYLLKVHFIFTYYLEKCKVFFNKFTALQLSNGELSDDAHFVQKLITLKINQLTNY